MVYICGTKLNTIEDIVYNIDNTKILGNKTCIITGCNLNDSPEGWIETIIVKDGKHKRIASHKVDIAMVGTGDFFAALVISQLAYGKQINVAVEFASDIVSKTLDYSTKHRYSEMNSESIMAVLGQEIFNQK